jgi:large subunit ribosomal protein L21
LFSQWRSIIYAIIESGSKQYKVVPGQTINVERLNMSKGDSVSLDRVLLISNGDQLTIGNPTIDGAKVFATVKDQIKDKKVIVFKYKPKVRYRKKTGHRQLLTKLTIDKIDQPSIEAELPNKSKRRKKEVAESGT